MQKNPLDSTASHRVMERAQAHPRSQAASFTA
jgi:hypothetical protein